MRSSIQRFTKAQNGSSAQYGVTALANFFNVFDYKGEHCFSCGHPWTEKGEMHYKHCRFYSCAPKRSDAHTHLHGGTL